jgi:hypothetical protein
VYVRPTYHLPLGKESPQHRPDRQVLGYEARCGGAFDADPGEVVGEHLDLVGEVGELEIEALDTFHVDGGEDPESLGLIDCIE